MNKKLLHFLLLLVLMFNSCATFKEQVDKQINQKLSVVNSELSQRFYLIGDAGNAEVNASTLPLLSLEKRLMNEQENATVVFLGDNVYQHGLPKKSDEGYELAAHRLQVQIDAVKDFKGRKFFIPGNHDYHVNGVKQLGRQEKYIQKALGKKSFYPKNGCPITSVKISDEVALIVIDSQWYLENWDDNPTMNDDCDIKTRKDFFLEFEVLIKKNRSKTTLVTIHHPLFSDGAHGGNFSAKQHISPTNRFPLPVLGTIANFIRKFGGVSPQDIQNKNYKYLVNRLTTISQESERVIFASGHEHNLQYIEKNNTIQIVSGAGGKISGVKKSIDSQYANAALGYAVLDIYKDGTTQLKFINASKNSDKKLFAKEIFSPYPTGKNQNVAPNFKKQIAASVYDKKATEKSGFYERIWGKHYRAEYGADVLAPVVNLDTLFGGLIPVKRGGGNQSVSLRLVDKDGRQWVMRALKKNAVQFLQINAYQQKFIKEDLKDTFLESFIEDVYTTAHPYASFVMPNLSDAIGVYHTNPKLFYIPKQKALKAYNDDYGDALYMIEEHVGETQVEQVSFGSPVKILSTLDLLEKLKKNPKHKVDEKAFVRARLFDMVLGDWDRHQDQWRWSKTKGDDGVNIYKPIPRDRDQVFSTYDGLLLKLITRILPSIRKMQTYDPEIRNLKKHNTNGSAVDVGLIKSLSLIQWEEEARYIQKHLTDEIIDAAFEKLPEAVKNENINIIKKTLKHRRDHVVNIANKYYRILNKNVILTATNSKDEIAVYRLSNGKTKITFSKKDEVYFTQEYDKKITKEIWIYALDGEDEIIVLGQNKATIPIKIIGGQNKDNFEVEDGKGITIVDYLSKKNNLDKVNDTKVCLTDNYQTNVYDYLKKKTKINQLIPVLGINKDDGFFVGFNNTLIIKNFKQNPFSQKHNLKLNYFIFNNGYDINYVGEYANVFKESNVQLGIEFTSPNYTANFFGMGNETTNNDAVLDLAYNRVKLARVKLNAGIVKHGDQGSEFSWLVNFESNKVANTSDRYIGIFPTDASVFNRTEFIGTEVNYRFKNFNDPVYPTLGMDFQVKAGWKTNVNQTRQNTSYLEPSLSFIRKLTNNERFVIANKTKANILFNDNFEFYQGATLGANNGLRGYRFQRFTGRSALYNSTDVRFNFRKFKTGFAPLNLGFYTGVDVGRVWLSHEKSNKWHNSFGGGIWLKVAEVITGNIGVFNSKEDTRISFGIGLKM